MATVMLALSTPKSLARMRAVASLVTTTWRAVRKARRSLACKRAAFSAERPVSSARGWCTRATRRSLAASRANISGRTPKARPSIITNAPSGSRARLAAARPASRGDGNGKDAGQAMGSTAQPMSRKAPISRRS
jgi:hypothetical protein